MREIQDHEHNGALDEVVRLLCRNLEFETWEGFHGRIYDHKERNHPSKVRPLASDLLTLLFALSEYFQCLTLNSTKLRVGEFCKRLYCYYFSLQGRPPNRLGGDDLQSLCEEMGFERNKMPPDKSKRAFSRWIGASDEYVLWWEESIREKEWLP